MVYIRMLNRRTPGAQAKSRKAKVEKACRYGDTITGQGQVGGSGKRGSEGKPEPNKTRNVYENKRHANM